MKAMNSPALVTVHNLVKHYRLPRERLFESPGRVLALDDVSFSVVAGRNFGIVGESGSGKSTLARLIMALEPPTSGSVSLLGQDPALLDTVQLRRARRNIQMVFQDPYGSLDPRQTVARIVAEPLAAIGKIDPNSGEPMGNAEVQRRLVSESLDAVGLRASDKEKYPHEFSGGQRQRIAIARALITRPKLIVADEPVSALDVSVQAQVLNLLADLQAGFGVTFILISHDLAVVDHLCEEVAVLRKGKIVEQGSPEQLFVNPQHEYTKTLLAAVPRAD